MSLAITDEHRALSDTVADFLAKHRAIAATRQLLEQPSAELPPFWRDLAGLGWLGLHLPEQYAGSGYGLAELTVVAEQLGAAVAPGPFAPTVIASATIAAADDEVLHKRWLEPLATGTAAGISLSSTVEVSEGRVTGTATVLSAGSSTVLLIVHGDDVLLVETADDGVRIETPANLDPGRPSSRVTFDSAHAVVLAAAAQTMTDIARTVLAAEAAGVAATCTSRAVEYAKVRQQFGRPIATYQAVKHHCANMAVATELTTAAAWDAGRAAAAGGPQFSYAAAVAATLAGPAVDLCANLSTQVHGGIAITWEDDAHLLMRRATMLNALLEPSVAAAQVADLVGAGVTREKSVDLPPEADEIRDRVRQVIAATASADDATRRNR